MKNPKLSGSFRVRFLVTPSNPAWLQFYLLFCLALGVFLCGRCLLLLANPAGSRGRYGELLASLTVLVLAFLLGYEALASGIPGIAVGSCGIILAAAHLRLAFLRTRQLPLSRPAVWMAVAVSMTAAAWSFERLYLGHLKLEGERINSLAHFGNLEPVPRCVAVTDRGRKMELFRWVNYLTQGADDVSAAPEDGQTNCHGWVFTRGEYLLREEEVEQILSDNGYVPCKTPRAGDLIVYRNPDGTISHTGVVQMSFLGRVPLIESKWGMGARFMHPPEVQPYGNHYTYYHSARQGHALAIRSG
jgi:hypothetical protein